MIMDLDLFLEYVSSISSSYSFIELADSFKNPESQISQVFQQYKFIFGYRDDMVNIRRRVFFFFAFYLFAIDVEHSLVPFSFHFIAAIIKFCDPAASISIK